MKAEFLLEGRKQDAAPALDGIGIAAEGKVYSVDDGIDREGVGFEGNRVLCVGGCGIAARALDRPAIRLLRDNIGTSTVGDVNDMRLLRAVQHRGDHFYMDRLQRFRLCSIRLREGDVHRSCCAFSTSRVNRLVENILAGDRGDGHGSPVFKGTFFCINVYHDSSVIRGNLLIKGNLRHLC